MEKLVRNIVVELIEKINLYEGKGIEVRFRYADRFEEAAEMMEGRRGKLPESGEKRMEVVS